MENFDIIELFAHADEFYRLASDISYREGGAASRIAVELRHDNARDIELFIKSLGNIDGVLTCHRVDDEEYLGGLRLLFDIEQLVHHRFVEMQTTRGIYENHIVAVFLGVTDGILRYFDGRNLIALGINGDSEFIADYLKLGYRGGTVNIACGKKRIFPLPLEKPCKPTIMMTVGGLEAIFIFDSVEPIRAVSSSFTIFITC